MNDSDNLSRTLGVSAFVQDERSAGGYQIRCPPLGDLMHDGSVMDELKKIKGEIAADKKRIDNLENSVDKLQKKNEELEIDAYFGKLVMERLGLTAKYQKLKEKNLSNEKLKEEVEKLIDDKLTEYQKQNLQREIADQVPETKNWSWKRILGIAACTVLGIGVAAGVGCYLAPYKMAVICKVVLAGASGFGVGAAGYMAGNAIAKKI